MRNTNKKIMIINVVMFYLFSITVIVSPVVGEENEEFVDLDIDSEVVMVNNDDDDDNGIPDMDQDGVIFEEDDLVLMNLEMGLARVRDAEPLLVPMTVNYSFIYPPNIRIWNNSQRGHFNEVEILNNTFYPHIVLILGDMNLDGFFNGFDTDVFYSALGDPEQYRIQYGIDPIINGDINGDGNFDGGDINPYIDYLGGNELRYAPARLWVEGLMSSLREIVISVQVDFGYPVTNDSDTVSITIPKIIISSPSSTIEGEIFEVSVTADDDPVNVEIIFGEDIYSTDPDGIAYISAPQVEEDTEYNITANKEGYTSVTVTIIVKEKALSIDVPLSVLEEEIFEVLVKEKATGQVVEGANVTFNGEVNQSDTNGKVNFQAPSIDTTTEYTLTASLSGYTSGITPILVLNRDEQEIDKGWFFGTVYSDTLLLLENVQILFSSGSTSWSVFTDDQGSYYIQIPADTYTIEVSLERYESILESGKILLPTSALEQNFILNKIPDYAPDPSEDINEQLLEDKITAEIKNNRVGGKIKIEDDYSVVLYNNELNIEIESVTSSEEIVKFKVGADEGAPSQVIVVLIKDLLDEISVEFDGEQISETSDLYTFFSTNNQNIEYVWISTEDSSYVLIHIPSFSEHTITITSLVEVVGGIVAVVLYIAIFVVFAIVTGIPMIRLWKKIE